MVKCNSRNSEMKPEATSRVRWKVMHITNKDFTSTLHFGQRRKLSINQLVGKALG